MATIELYRKENQTQLEGHLDSVNSVTYSLDGKQLVSGSSDAMVRIWDGQTLQPVTQLKGHSLGIMSLCIVQTGSS
jgi:WD40 repeat protein